MTNILRNIFELSVTLTVIGAVTWPLWLQILG